MKKGYEIHGRVTFVTEKEGKLVSTQERGWRNGTDWLEQLLVYAAFMMSADEVERLSVRAIRRVRKQESKPRRPLRARATGWPSAEGQSK